MNESRSRAIYGSEMQVPSLLNNTEHTKLTNLKC